MSMPRIIRVEMYRSEHVDNGRGGKKLRLERLHAYLDVGEVEMIMAPSTGPYVYSIRMKSGKEFDVDEESYERIAKAFHGLD